MAVHSVRFTLWSPASPRDVEVKAGTVTVSQRADQWGDIGPPKSKAGYRAIPIGPAIVAELREWRLRCPKGPLGLAFPHSEGGVLHHSNLLNRHYWPAQVRAGVCTPTGKVDEEDQPIMRAKYGLHALRHAAASAWIRQSVDLKRLTSWMGHSSVQITLDTYGHLIADAAGDAEIAAAAQAELLA